MCDGQPVPDYAALADLEYTEQVITEALLLRLPSWSISRQATLDSCLGATRIERDGYLYRVAFDDSTAGEMLFYPLTR